MFGDYFQGVHRPPAWGRISRTDASRWRSTPLSRRCFCDHAGQAGLQDAGEDLGGDLHQGGLQAPEVAHGLGHLDPDGAGADDDGAAHFAFGDLFPDRHGGGEAGRRS